MSVGYRKLVGALLGLVLFFGGCHESVQVTKGPAAEKGAASREAAEAQAAEDYEGPYLTVDRSEHDFGEVEPSEEVHCAFTLTNSGKKPVKIEKVRPDCGCTVAELKKYTLAPGESEKLEVRFQTPSREGATRKTLTVLVSPPGRPVRLPLSLRAEVRPTIKVTPAQLTLELRGEEKVSATVTLTSREGEAFAITGYRGQGNLHVLFEAGRRGTSHEVTVEGEASKLAGKPSATVIIDTDHPKKKSLPVQVKVVPPFAVRPTIRTFLNMKAGESRTGTVTVYSNFGEVFALGEEIRSRNGHAKVSKVSQVNEQTYQVEFEMTAPADMKGKALRDVLVIPIAGHPGSSVQVHCYLRLK